MTAQEKERLAVVETELKNTRDDIQGVKTEMKDGFKGINDRFDKLESKFAAKWVQTVVSGLIAAILLGFIGVIVAYFIPQKQQPTNPVKSPSTSNSETVSTGSTGSTSTPSANARASSTSTSEKPTDTQSTSSQDGLLDGVLKKVTN